MATQIKLRRGTTSEHASFNGAEGEVTFDTDLHTLIVHNNAGAGSGERLAKYSELGTALTVSDAGTDTTMFPLLSTDALGGINPKTDASAYTYNASTGTLTATIFSGNLTGNVTGNVSGSSGSCTGNSATATLASTVTVSDNTANTNFPLVFHDESNGLLDDTGTLTYNPSSATLTATTFSGALSGNATTATTATNVVVTDNENTDENNAITFVANADIDGSTSAGLESDGNLTYNPSTGTLTATTFSGALSGNATTASSASALDGTAKITTVVNSTLQTATNFFGQRMIHTGGAVTYSFAAVSSSDVGKSVTVINSGTASITLSITTSKFYDLTAGVAPDYSGSGSSSHTLLKGGVAEFIVTEANKIIIIGSGVI